MIMQYPRVRLSSFLPSLWRLQVALSIKYGHVLLYDDTAVKNMYRLPVGIGVVIDGEYFTRVVFQMIASDTQTTTFEWMMDAWKETRGGQGPDVFIQDADAACTLAAQSRFPGATMLRCQWHLYKNVREKLGPILGQAYQVSSHFPVCRCDSAWVVGLLGQTGRWRSGTRTLSYVWRFALRVALPGPRRKHRRRYLPFVPVP